MFIWDWSSDVFSSDLPPAAAFGTAPGLGLQYLLEGLQLIAAIVVELSRMECETIMPRRRAGGQVGQQYRLRLADHDGAGDHVADPLPATVEARHRHQHRDPGQHRPVRPGVAAAEQQPRSAEHTSELQSLMRISYAG